MSVGTGARRLAVSVLAIGLLTPAAHGSIYDFYGFNPRAASMAGAMTAATRDYTATFYNPAAMTVGKQVRLGAGIVGVVPKLFIERSQADPKNPTYLPDPAVGFTLGWLHPLGGIFEDKLALAVSLYLPFGKLARVQGLPRQAPQFYMYQSLHDKILFLAAAAFEPFEWLSIGAGIQILADLAGGARLSLDVIDSRFEARDFSVELQPSASPVVGLLVRPLDGLSIGAS